MVSVYTILWIIFISICVVCVVLARVIEYKFERDLYKYGPISGKRVKYIPCTARYGKYVISYTDDNNVKHMFITKFIYRDPSAGYIPDMCPLIDVHGKIYSMCDYEFVEYIISLIAHISSYIFVVFFVIDILTKVF